MVPLRENALIRSNMLSVKMKLAGSQTTSRFNLPGLRPVIVLSAIV